MASALSSEHPRPVFDDVTTSKKLYTGTPAKPEIGALDQQDLLKKILGFLPLQEIGKNASLVNHQWRSCSKTTIQTPQVLTLEILSIYKRLLSDQWQVDFSQVHSIFATGKKESEQTHIDDFLASAHLWAKSPKLRRVRAPHLSIKQTQDLFSVLADSPTLTDLDLQGLLDSNEFEASAGIDPENQTRLGKHQLPQESIDLSPVSFPALQTFFGGWIPWPILAQLSGRAPNLTSFSLEPSSLFNGDAARLFLYGQLKELRLEELYTEEPVNDVLEGIAEQCPQITSLNLLSIGTEKRSDLYAISKFKQLTDLHIKDFPMPTAVLRAILMGCQNLGNLTLTGEATDLVDDNTFFLLQEYAKQLYSLALLSPEDPPTLSLISFEAVQCLFQNPEFETFYGYIPGFVDACEKFKINPDPFLTEDPKGIRLQFEIEEIEKIPPPIRRAIDLSVRIERERIRNERDLMALQN